MNPAPDSPTPKRRPLVSLPFLACVVVMAVAAYFAGPHVMQWVMYQQELAKSKQVIVSSSASDQAPDETASMGIGGGGGGRGNFDPAAFFAERDADGNGLLEGEEISDRLRQNLADTDTDGDGAVSQEEFLLRMQQRRGRGGGGPQNPQSPPGDAAEPAGPSATPQSDPPADSSGTDAQDAPTPEAGADRAAVDEEA